MNRRCLYRFRPQAVCVVLAPSTTAELFVLFERRGPDGSTDGLMPARRRPGRDTFSTWPIDLL